MGAQSAQPALTESRRGAASAGSHVFVGVDVGRQRHQVAAIPHERMEDGSWERSPVRSFVTNAKGFRDLVAWLEGSGLPLAQVRVGCEPTGGWHSRTVVSWLETYGAVPPARVISSEVSTHLQGWMRRTDPARERDNTASIKRQCLTDLGPRSRN